jgi:hypothetical protein
MFLLICLSTPSKDTNDLDNSHAEKTTWDLKRDIIALRPMSCIPGQLSYISLKSGSIQFQAPDINKGPTPDFGIIYPLPRGDKTVVIEMELRWNTPDGTFQILFDTTSPNLFSGSGVAFSCESVPNVCRPGMTLGRLRTFRHPNQPQDYVTASMPLGSGWETLKIVLKKGSITCTVGSKTLAWTGKFAPKHIMISGDHFWSIDVRKFDMRVKMAGKSHK